MTRISATAPILILAACVAAVPAAANPVGGHPMSAAPRVMRVEPAQPNWRVRHDDDARLRPQPTVIPSAPVPAVVGIPARYWHPFYDRPLTGLTCPNLMFGPRLFDPPSADVFTRSCFGSADAASDTTVPTHLVPGQNKDALYGRAYHPSDAAFE